MGIIRTTEVPGALVLFFGLCLSALSAHSKFLARNGASDGARRSWESKWLILLNFVLMLLILIWRAS